MGRGWRGWENVKVDKNGCLDTGDGIIYSKPLKYHNQPMIVDGVRYHSKAEGRYAEQLNILQKAGAIKFYLRQVCFLLPGNTRHYVDFLVEYPDGTHKWVEVKGRDLPMGKMKRKQVEAIYGIKIELVK